MTHGGDIYTFSKELGCEPDEVIDFSSNINFLKPQVDLDSVAISPYPDSTYSVLKGDIAKYLGVSMGEIELYNGASSAIFALLSFLQPKEVTLYAPIYSEYKRACSLFGIDMELVNRFERTVEPKGSTIIFVNPSTPDGMAYDTKVFLEKCMELKATLILDESFIDFSDSASLANELNNYNELYIVRSFTKFFSCAGVRVGCILSNNQNISKIAQREPLWKLSAYDSAYLSQALKDGTFIAKSKKQNLKNRELLLAALTASRLFEKIFDSNTNFLLAKLINMSSSTLQERLKAHKILIRDCGNFDFLDSSYVRFAVKSEADISILAHALHEVSRATP